MDPSISHIIKKYGKSDKSYENYDIKKCQQLITRQCSWSYGWYQLPQFSIVVWETHSLKHEKCQKTGFSNSQNKPNTARQTDSFLGLIILTLDKKKKH